MQVATMITAVMSGCFEYTRNDQNKSSVYNKLKFIIL